MLQRAEDAADLAATDLLAFGFDLSQSDLAGIATNELVIGNSDAGASKTTDITVGAVDMRAFDMVALNALAASTVTLGTASFDNLNVNTGTVNVIGDVTATSVDFNVNTANLEADLVSATINGTAGTVNVNADNALGTEEIQDGIDVAAAVGATVNVGAGTYIESVDVDKSVTLLGANAGVAGDDAGRGAETIINPNSPGFHVTADNVTIDGFTVDGATNSGGFGTGNGVFVDGADNATIANNIITNSAFRGVSIFDADNAVLRGNSIDGSSFQGVFAQTFDGLMMDGNRITNSQTRGVELFGGSNATIKNNTVSDSGTAALSASSVSGLTIENNFISDALEGFRGAGNAGVSIFENSFTNMADALIVNLGLAVNASGNYWGTTDEETVADGMTGFGDVDFTPFLMSGVDMSAATGFQGDFSNVQVTALGAQTGPVGRINEGVAEVDNGGIVNVGAGTFTEFVLVDKDITVRGVLGSIVEPNSPGFLVTAAGSGATIENFEIVGGETGVLVDGANNVTVQNNHIHGQVVPAAPALWSNGDGVFLMDSNGSTVSGNRIDNVEGDGVHAHNFSDLTVTDNRFADIGDAGVEFSGTGSAVTMTGNVFADSMPVFIRNEVSGLNVFAGNNTFAGYNPSTDPFDLDTLFVLEDKTDHILDDENFGSVTYIPGTWFVTTNTRGIQAGVDAASAGNTVYVDDGIFTESVTIGKELTLLGANAGIDPNEVPTMRGDETTVLPGLTEVGFRVTGTGVTIDGFTIANGLAGVDLSGSTDATVRNNIFTGGLWGVGGNFVSGASVENNLIKNTTAQGVNFSFLTGMSHITGNVIDGNGVTNTGIVLTDSSDVTVSGNTIEEVQFTAINVSDSSDVTIGGATLADGNILTGHNAETAIDVNDGDTITVAHNDIDDFETGVDINGTTGTNDLSGNVMISVEYGVLANTVSGLTISGNDISGNSMIGIDVFNSDGATVSANTLDNFVTGINVTGSDGVTIGGPVAADGNTISNTTDTAISVTGDATDSYVIANNIITGDNKDGISAIGGDEVEIENNQLGTVGNAIEGFGIFAANIGILDILGNTLFGNNSADGISIVNSNDAFIGDVGLDEGNTVNNFLTGIRVAGSDNTQVLENTVNNSGFAGIFVTDNAGDMSDFVNIDGNTVTGSTTAGVFVKGGTGATVNDNDVNGTTGTAVHIDGADNSAVTMNRVNGGLFGVRIHDGNNSNISTANVIQNVGTGIKLSDMRGLNTVTGGNIIHHTTADGVLAERVAGLGVSGNFIGLSDAGVTPAGPDNIGGNGVSLDNSDNAKIFNNKITETKGHGILIGNGISLNPSPNSVIQGNMITNVGADGIHAEGSDNLTIGGLVPGQANTIYGTIGDGIEVLDAADINIQGNFIGTDVAETDRGDFNIGGKGINAENGALDTNTTISGNRVADTVGAGISYTKSFAGNPPGNTLLFQNNVLSDIGVRGIELFLKNTTPGTFTVSGNNITGTGNDGIYFDRNRGAADVFDNTIINAGANGIHTLFSFGDVINHTTIRDNTITDATTNGVYVERSTFVDVGSPTSLADGNVISGGQIGIYNRDSNDTTIRFNTIRDTTAGSFHDGIQVLEGDDLLIADNLIERVGGHGIFAQAALNLQIVDNEINDSADQGIRLFGNGNNNFTITGNDIDDAGKTGISVAGVSGDIHGLIRDNTVNNTGHAASQNDDGGIYLQRTINTTIDLNTVTNVTGEGIRIGVIGGNAATDTSGNIIASNIVNNTTRDGIQVDKSTGVEIKDNAIGYTTLAATTSAGDDNIGGEGIDVNGSSSATISGNKITQTVGHGISVNPSDFVTITDNFISNIGKGGDAIAADGINVLAGKAATITGNTIWNTEADGIDVNGNTPDGAAHLLVSGNFIGTNAAGNDLDDNNIGADGIKVTTSLEAEITGNTVVDTFANGIQVISSDGTNLLNGAQVTGNFVGTNAAGDVFGADNIGANGIYINSSDYANVDGNTIEETVLNGILVNPSSFVTITGNMIHDINADGINVLNGLAATITGNTIYSTGGDGIDVSGNAPVFDIGGNLINNLLISGNYIGTNSDHDFFGWGNVKQNGILVNGSANANIIDNDVYYTRWDGIHVENSADAIIDINYIRRVSDDGIDVRSSDHVRITGNDIDNTGDDGIRVLYSDYAFIDHNILDDIDDEGIYVYDSYYTEVSWNEIEDVDDKNGIYIEDSDHANIHNNYIDEVEDENGILVEDSNDVRVVDNRITYIDDESGIYIDNSDRAFVSGNEIDDVDEEGIYVTSSNDVTLLKNTIYDSWRGISVNSSLRTVIDQNIIYDISRDAIEVNGGHGVDAASGIQIKNNWIGFEFDESLGVDGEFVSDGPNSIRGEGIDVNGSNYVNIDGNHITATRSNAISVNPSTFITIANNIITFAGDNGIKILSSPNASIHDNYIDNTTDDGIDVAFSDFALIERNHIGETGGLRNIGDDGIDVEDSDNVLIAGNILNNIDDNGIDTLRTNGLRVLRNTITGSGDSTGIDIFSGVQLLVDDNTISGFNDGIDIDTRNVGSVGFNRTVTVTNNDVTGLGMGSFGTGIEVDGDNLTNLDVSDNVRMVDVDGVMTPVSGVTDFYKGIEVDVYNNDGTNLEAHIDSNFIRANEMDDGSFYGDYGVYAEFDVNGDGTINATVDHNILNGFAGEAMDIYAETNRGDLTISVSNNEINASNHMDDGDAYGDYGLELNLESYEGTINATIDHNMIDGLTSGFEYGIYADLYTDYGYINASFDDNTVTAGLYGDTGIMVDIYNEYEGDIDVTIDRNTVTGFDYAGIYADLYTDYGYVDVSVNDNIVTSVFGDYGIMIYAESDDGDVDVMIDPNTVTGFEYGIYADAESSFGTTTLTIIDNILTGNADGRGTGIMAEASSHRGDSNVVISRNTVSDFGNGIDTYMDIYYGNGTLEINDNTVTAPVTFPEHSNGGLGIEAYLMTYNGNLDVEIDGNGGDTGHVNGFANGIWVMTENAFGRVEDSAWEHNIVVSRNNVNAGGFVPMMDGGYEGDYDDDDNDNDNDNGIGILVRAITGDYYSDDETGPVFATVEENNVNDFIMTGIHTENLNGADILFNNVTNSGENGFHAAGPDNGSVVLSGNVFTNNTVGALFESGEIDLTGPTNTFNGGDIGMLFRPAEMDDDDSQGGPQALVVDPDDDDEPMFADMSLVNNTIGTTVFNGQSEFFIELDNGAFFNPGTPTILNALNATFNGVNPASQGGLLTIPQFNAIEDGIFHFTDRGDLGLFFFGIGLPFIDQEDIFRAIGPFTPPEGGLSVTLTGLPVVPGVGGAAFFANLEPAAGEGEEGTAEDVADIEPAAGGEEVSCWADAVAGAGAGQTVNFSFGAGLEAAISGAAGCELSGL